MQSGSFNFFFVREMFTRTLGQTLRVFVLQTSLIISLQEALLIRTLRVLIINTLWKWNKVLLFLVNLELISVTVFVLLLRRSRLRLLVLIVFFVGEALILINSFFSSLRLSGERYARIRVWCCYNYLFQFWQNKVIVSLYSYP